MTKVAVLDDWQDVARKSADWSPLASRADLTFFTDAFETEDEAAAALADFDILLTMRERTAFPETLIRRLPKPRMIGITGARVATLDLAACSRQGIVVSRESSFYAQLGADSTYKVPGLPVPPLPSRECPPLGALSLAGPPAKGAWFRRALTLGRVCS